VDCVRPRTCSGTRKYKVLVFLNWSSAKHPGSDPPGGYVSASTVAAHTSRCPKWAPGTFASTAITTAAETINPTPLRKKLTAYTAAGHLSLWPGMDAPIEDATETVEQTATADATTGATTVSEVAMLFALPEWFTSLSAVAVYTWGRPLGDQTGW